MGKGDRRGKTKPRAMAELAELAPTPKRQPNGQHRTRRDAPRDPRRVALGARCLMFGVPDTKTNRDALSGQHSGSQLGWVMQAICPMDQIPRLWGVWQGFQSAERTYRLRYIGQTGTPQGAAIAMVPDRMETDQSMSVDLRDADQRDREAVSNYMRWRGYIGHLTAPEQGHLHRLFDGCGAAIWADGPTRVGLATLDALKRLADVVESA